MSRVRCPKCRKRRGAATVQNNKGCCPDCGHDMGLANWIMESRYNIRGLPLTEEQSVEFYNLAMDQNVHPKLLVQLALTNRLFVWSSDNAVLKNDMMLAKLAKPHG